MASDPSRGLQGLREDVGLSQEQLAYRSGVAVATIKRAERGALPKVVTLEKITLVLGVPMDDLIKAIRAGIRDEPEPEAATG